MKKNPIIFIAMLIALAFTSCQMNTDDSSTPTEATSYKVVYGDQELKNGLTLAQAEAYIAQIPLIETTDYSIDKVKGVVTLTESGYKKLNSYFETNGEPTTTEPTDEGNDDTGDGTGENTNPPATIEYTVSVADGIKGGYIEVSTDKENWTKLSTTIMFAKTSVKYEKGTKVYVRAVANNSFYKLKIMNYTSSKDDGGVLANSSSSCITIDANITLNATFEIEKRDIETLKGEITSGKSYSNNLKCGVGIYYYGKTFTDTYNNVKIVFGFDENYYEGLTASTSYDGITSKSGDKPDYYYVCETTITQFYEHQLGQIVGVNITGDNFILPDTGRIYVLAETKEGNKIMIPALDSFSANKIKFKVELN